MNTCAPKHHDDPVIARFVLDVELCPDGDPVKSLEDLPEALLDLVDNLADLHEASLSATLGSLFYRGSTSKDGRSSIQYVRDADEEND